MFVDDAKEVEEAAVIIGDDNEDDSDLEAVAVVVAMVVVVRRSSEAAGCGTIFLEKPGAPTVGELRRMQEEARIAGVSVLMGYNKVCYILCIVY